MKVLADTQAGKRIRLLCRHTDSSIASAASEAVTSWKSIVRKESSTADLNKSQSQSMERNPQGASQPSSQYTIPSPAVPPTINDAKAEVTSTKEIPLTGDSIRDKCRTHFVTALELAVNEGVAGHDPIATGVALETALHLANNGVNQGYKGKFRQLHFNLKDEKNPDLRRKILTGEIAPDVLISLPPEELASDAKREENQKIRDKKLFDSAPSQAKQATTDQFQCGKCKQRKTTYYQMQTRSADEPMTTFVSCLNCNNRWKFC